MPDIGMGDNPKRLLRMAMWWFRRKYAEGRDKDDIHDDIVNCGNPILRRLHDIIIHDGADNIEETYQNAMIRDGMELILWTIYKDTAYRDPFFYVLKKILDNKKEFEPVLNKYLKNPDDWYINTWTRTKKNTEELRKNGKIAASEMSPDEEIFVPQYQYKKVYDIIESDVNKEKKRRGW